MKTEKHRKWIKDHPERIKSYWLAGNKSEKRKIWRKARMDMHRAKLADLRNKPCADCGGSFHFSAMDFDHLPGTVKKFTISTCMTNSLKSILEEVAKCEVVCSNCHRVRTWNRRRPVSEQYLKNLKRRCDVRI